MAKYLTSNSTAKNSPSVNSEKKFNVSDYLHLNNKLPEAKCIHKVLILYVGMLFLFWTYGCWCSSAKICFPPKPRWMDCKHCNAQLFPDCESLTSSNNHPDTDLQFASPWSAMSDGSRWWDSWMAAQALIQDLARPSSDWKNWLKRWKRLFKLFVSI